ncbi:MAG: isocitrate lyase/phosphoenolpyruvate mutase family protein [Ferruginibacter sp.]
MDQFETFLQLHNAETPVLIANIWDAGSAKLLEQNGAKAIATSSAALALSLGYEDGENIPFELMLETVKRIKNNISLPLSVDMERGFSNSIAGIVQNIERLCDIGVAGINIEDSTASKSLQPMEAFEKTIFSIASHLSQKNLKLFINARTDGFLLKVPNALVETERRIKLYENAGANGIFVPFITEEADIKTVVKATSLPVNVLAVPGLRGLTQLSSLGVKRISLGSFLYRSINREVINKINKINADQSLDTLF